MTRNLLKSTAIGAVVTLTLALSACFNPPMGVGKKAAEAQQYTEDGRPLVNIQVSLGGGGGHI
jgi:starvation-inducible outer membrane lipoprotein